MSREIPFPGFDDPFINIYSTSINISSTFKYLLASGIIDILNDEFKIILTKGAFEYSNQYSSYDDIALNEITAENGYVTGGNVLTGVAVTTVDTVTTISWASSSWIALGGSIGSPLFRSSKLEYLPEVVPPNAITGVLIYDNSLTLPTNNPIVGAKKFSSWQVQNDGGQYTVSNIGITLESPLHDEPTRTIREIPPSFEIVL